jgi:hypothetical protein
MAGVQDINKSIPSLFDLCVQVSNVDSIKLKGKLPDVAEYAKQAKELFLCINKVRAMYFQAPITWFDYFGNFDMHFNSFVNHFHPQVLAYRKMCLNIPAFFDHSQRISAESKLVSPRLSLMFSNYDNLRTELSNQEPMVHAIVAGNVRSPTLFRDTLKSDNGSNSICPRTPAYMGYDCCAWGLSRITNRSCLSVVSLIRYIEGSERTDMLITLCELEIIKRRDVYTSFILNIAVNAFDLTTVKWLTRNSYVSEDSISFNMLDKFAFTSWQIVYNVDTRKQEETRFEITKVLLNYINNGKYPYSGWSYYQMDILAMRLYCKDPVYAKLMCFRSIKIDRTSLMFTLVHYKNFGDLLEVATLHENANIVETDLVEFVRNDRDDLIRFIFAQTNITVESIRVNFNKLFLVACKHKSVNVLQFLYQQGMEWTDISTDLLDINAQYFLSVTSPDD